MNPNELNQASVFVFEKSKVSQGPGDFVSPVSKFPLERRGCMYVCEAEGSLYPVVQEIPVLRSSAAIICSRASELLAT